MIKVLILIFISSLSYAGELSINEVIRLMAKNDPEYQQIELSYKALETIGDSLMPELPYTLSLGQERGYTSDGSDSIVFDGSLSKQIFQSATDLSVGYSKTERPDREENVTQIRLSQSLYKNAFGASHRKLKTSAHLERSIQEYELYELKEDYLLSAISRIIIFEKNRNELLLSKNILKESKNILKTTKQKFGSNIASSTDFNRAKYLVLESEVDHSIRDSTFKKTEDTLFQIIGNTDLKISPNQLDSLLIVLENNYSKGSRKLIELKNYQKSIEQQKQSKINYQLQDDELNADLQFVVGYNEDDSTRFATAIKRNETVLGFKLVLPFGNESGKAKLAQAKIDELKAQANLKKVHQNLNINLNNSIQNVEQSRKVFELTTKKANLMVKILADEVKRFKRGKLSLEDLITVRNQYAKDQQEASQAKISYIEALLNWCDFQDRLVNIFL